MKALLLFLLLSVPASASNGIVGSWKLVLDDGTVSGYDFHAGSEYSRTIMKISGTETEVEFDNGTYIVTSAHTIELRPTRSTCGLGPHQVSYSFLGTDHLTVVAANKSWEVITYKRIPTPRRASASDNIVLGCFTASGFVPRGL